MNLLVDMDPPRSREALDKLGEQVFRFLCAAAHRVSIWSALRERGYDSNEHVRGQKALEAAIRYAHPSKEAIRTLHAWLWNQHLRALGANMRRADLIALGVVNRRVRVIPEQSGVVLKGARR